MLFNEFAAHGPTVGAYFPPATSKRLYYIVNNNCFGKSDFTLRPCPPFSMNSFGEINWAAGWFAIQATVCCVKFSHSFFYRQHSVLPRVLVSGFSHSRFRTFQNKVQCIMPIYFSSQEQNVKISINIHSNYSLNLPVMLWGSLPSLKQWCCFQWEFKKANTMRIFSKKIQLENLLGSPMPSANPVDVGAYSSISHSTKLITSHCTCLLY